MFAPVRPLLVVAALLALIAPACASPALWRVSDEDSHIWLFGSVHLLPPDMQWRTQIFDKTLNKADRVYFETDIGPEAQTAIIAQGFKLGFNTDGKLLSAHLDETQLAALREAAGELYVPMSVLLAMRPWMAADTLSVSAMAAAGFDPNSGVDLQLQQELPAERKGYFETGEEQVNLLAGAPEDEQIAMLTATIDEIDQIPETLDAMVDSWRAGTPDGLAELFKTELGGYDEAFAQRLIYGRNQNWMTPIKAMLADNEQAFIIVGTGHLIGDDSVIDLLGKSGFSVERIQ